jgi:hypothetical protein
MSRIGDFLSRNSHLQNIEFKILRRRATQISDAKSYQTVTDRKTFHSLERPRRVSVSLREATARAKPSQNKYNLALP